ncbi:formylglycine-generating enzyme family protein [bacterium]|nr:formylglycine-generating enzyme family protein [bacterium]MBU1073524.1 formylglycine-generating enzyme family protein [bacterium]MBU1676416.1 formylglycine-generating enzyme family protein [bacterium]
MSRIWVLTVVLTVAASLAAAAEPPEGMVLIPGGAYAMGMHDGEDNPLHEVAVSPFYMDRTEVTNAGYLAFCEETGRDLPVFWGMELFRCGPDYPDNPIVGVSHSDAIAYAEWAGKRLPTEAEWEFAARGGLVGKMFPNGDDADPLAVNHKGAGYEGTLPVGSLLPNGYGLHDMSGNVREWVLDRYDPDYYRECPAENPQGPEQGRFRVIRGGGWYSGAFCNHIDRRNGLPSNFGDFNVGFRCAKDVETAAD